MFVLFAEEVAVALMPMLESLRHLGQLLLERSIFLFLGNVTKLNFFDKKVNLYGIMPISKKLCVGGCNPCIL